MLKFNVDPILVHLGPLAISWYGLAVMVAIFAGVWLTLREARRKGLPAELVMDLVFWIAIGGLVGARVVFRTNHAVIARLSLKGPRNRGYASWLLQARQFYTGALGDPAILQSLNGCGITCRSRQDGGDVDWLRRKPFILYQQRRQCT